MPPGGDKPWHLLAYIGLGVVVARAVAGGLPAAIGWRTAVTAIVIGVGYAVTDELHQMFVPGRTAQLTDLIADAIGVCAGVVMCQAWGWAHGKSQVTRHKAQGTPKGSGSPNLH